MKSLVPLTVMSILMVCFLISLELGWLIFCFCLGSKTRDYMQLSINVFFFFFFPFLMPWYKEIFFLCCRELMDHWSQDLPLSNTIQVIAHSDPFITVMVPSCVSGSPLCHFCFPPLGTKLQAFSSLQAFIEMCCWVGERHVGHSDILSSLIT